ncbi:MAG: sulfatase [Anaerohalosphaera sp.]|nr:sulfatase [Anaerohalosphaera sp.]
MMHTRRKFLQTIGIGFGALMTASFKLSANTPKLQKPNVIIIFTDDQGYQDIGCFGSPKIKTPNLDRMAQEGMRFTDFYSANSVCSPSRAALLTGCYPPRVGITKVLFSKDSIGLNPKEITIADMLKDHGYATACIGKWHLGHLPEFLPTKQGFDSYFGIPYSNDMKIDPKATLADDVKFNNGMTEQAVRTQQPKKNFVPLMRNDKVIEYPADQSTLTQRYTQEAIRFITENRSKPFFLYLPHTMPHIPIFASPDFKGKSARGLYGDVIEEIDFSTGEIIKTLKSLGIDENTLIVFTSDNGPWNLKNGHGGCALPLRGFKFQTYEGGMRVPAIMRWPGKIPPEKVCSEVAATIDMLPTIAHLTGAKVPDDRVIDGKNIWPLMSGQKNALSPHQEYFYYRGTKLQAVRVGKWKLRIEKEDELYDLQADISEKNNLAKQEPEMVNKLKAIMNDFDKDLKNNARPAGKAG